MSDTKNALNYKPAVLKIAGLSASRPGDFFIEFYYRESISKPFERFRKTYDLNRIDDIKERRAVAELMIESINELLEEGINPEGKDTQRYLTNLSTKDALEQALKEILQPLNKPRTIGSYRSNFKILITHLEKLGLLKKVIVHFSKHDALAVQKQLIASGLAPKTTNLKIEFAATLFKQMKRMDVIESNPFEVVKPLKVLDKMEEVFTVEEITRIKKHLLREMPELWLYSCFVYYCFCRPDQISRIKRADINLTTKSLFVNAEDHKNNSDQFKQLLVPMIPLLRRHCADVKPEHYLFSRKLQPGDFHNKSTRAAEYWNKLVKKGLGIEKDMYSLKATGALHYAMNNKGQESLKWLQMQLSHADLQTTSIYLNRLIASHAFYLDERNDKILDF